MDLSIARSSLQVVAHFAVPHHLGALVVLWCLLQLMTFPLHRLPLPWRVVFCYPVDAMLKDCTPSLSHPAGVAGSTAASSVGLALWAPSSVP